MTFTEWIELLQRDYPCIGQARVESHSVHRGEFYGKDALQINFIINTGLVIELDSTHRADGSKENVKKSKPFKKEEGAQCGTSTETKE